MLTIAGFLGDEDGFETVDEDGFEAVELEVVGISESGVSSKVCRMFKTDGISYDP